MKIVQKSLLTLMILALTACSWVQITPEGEKVRVLSKEEVTGCRHVGKTTVSTKGKIAGIDRVPEQVQDELDALARNSAPEINGDTVVRVGTPQNGKQVYLVYHCMPVSK